MLQSNDRPHAACNFVACNKSCIVYPCLMPHWHIYCKNMHKNTDKYVGALWLVYAYTAHICDMYIKTRMRMHVFARTQKIKWKWCDLLKPQALSIIIHCTRNYCTLNMGECCLMFYNTIALNNIYCIYSIKCHGIYVFKPAGGNGIYYLGFEGSE